MNQKLKYLVITALFIAVGLVIPSAFHMFGDVAGKVFSPLHLPVLICGFLCGPFYGLLCGIILPLLASLINGMPPLFPVAIGMMLELGVYGLVGGYLYQNKHLNIYIALLIAMLLGRLVGGGANLVMLSMQAKSYTLAVFFSAYFVNAVPAIILQLAIVPPISLALLKVKR